MAAIKNVVVIGAGGNVGPHVLSALQSAKFNVTVLSRESSSATFPSDVKVHKSDYSHASLVSIFKGQDAIVSPVASAAVPEQKKFIDAAVEAGVKRYIPGDFGSDTTDQKVLDVVPVLGPKKDVLDYLKSKVDSGLTYTAIANGAFFDWGLQVGFLGFDLKNHTARLFDDGSQKFSATNLPTVGRAVAAVLEKPAETANKFLFIRSVTTSQKEILAALEKATGKKWEVTKVDSKEELKIGQDKLAKSDFSGVLNLLAVSIYGFTGLCDFENKGLSNELLGLPKETVEGTVAKLV
ncbi:MAG: hypothetical protein M1819_003943 [Sarea resinae]|nr:MAG: hypothetical protein M1819_003943 [Sarea resinae]